MEKMKIIHRHDVLPFTWRHALLIGLVFGSLVYLLSLDPISQNTKYHLFADTRSFIGIPNCIDVLSNLLFLAVGILGLQVSLRRKLGNARIAWIILFVGVGLVSVGSAYYHWNPSNETLVWDRLPMTIGFMGLFVALLGEYVDKRLVRLLLFPAIALGIASVLYWNWTDDLRPYYWVQFFPLLALPALMILFRNNYCYSHQWLLPAALFWYVLAKVTELYDVSIFSYTQGFVSGHSLKHLFAATGCYTILIMLQRRNVQRN